MRHGKSEWGGGSVCRGAKVGVPVGTEQVAKVGAEGERQREVCHASLSEACCRPVICSSLCTDAK